MYIFTMQFRRTNIHTHSVLWKIISCCNKKHMYKADLFQQNWSTCDFNILTKTFGAMKKD